MSRHGFDMETAARGFAAIGAPARLEVLRELVRAGSEGLAVGDIQQRTGMPASTLAYHLRTLADADLIIRSRQGRTIMTMAAYGHLQALAGYILDECCADDPQQGPGHRHSPDREAAR